MAAGQLQFDLPRGVELAGMAFRAYCEPKPVHPFEDFNVKETTVLVLDKDFLTQAFWGVLEVQLVSAHNLPSGVPGELLGAPNTYAVVSMVSPDTDLDARARPYKFTSGGVSRNPTWDPNRPAMLFPVRDPATDLLHIELYDEAPGGSRLDKNGRKLGCAALQLNSLQQAGEGMVEKKMHLTMPACSVVAHSCRSHITIMCRLRKMEDADPAHLQAITTFKHMPMSWDAPMEIGLRVVEWLRRWAYDKVTWNYLKDVMRESGALRGDLVPLAFIENRSTRTEAWVFRNTEDKRVVVAFRGTNETLDWIVDLRVLPVPDSSIRPQSEPGPPGVDPHKIRVHRGFLAGYNSVRKAVLKLVDAVLWVDGGHEPWKVEVTGHSLGGALATLAAYDLAWSKRERDRRPQEGVPPIGNVAMVTLGQPRVGNEVFAKDFNAVVPDAWRFHNHNDIVSSVPFTFGFWNFTHVGKDVRMSWGNKPTAADHEKERWWGFKLLSTTPVSSHLEFRYQDTMLQMVRKWIQDRPPHPHLN